MVIHRTYHPERNAIYRILDHAKLGLSKEIGDRSNCPRNIVEKSGDGILWTLDLLPRAVKALGKSFQDPRVVTVALTALGLFAATLVFYPTMTVAATKATCIAIYHLVKHVPLWAVKLSAYIATCANIIGAGLRAGGRFNNAALMKEFYNIPSDYPHNPSRLYVDEIVNEQRRVLAY